jgi:hypothetical protein
MAEFSAASAGGGTIANGPIYGWSLNFFGLTGTVTGVAVSLSGLSHAFPDDLGFVL